VSSLRDSHRTPAAAMTCVADEGPQRSRGGPSTSVTDTIIEARGPIYTTPGDSLDDRHGTYMI